MSSVTLGQASIQETSLAAAATVDIGATTTAKVLITGAGGPITAFGTGVHKLRWFRFDSSGVVLTHNSTSLILPGAANITSDVGANGFATSDGSGHWRVRWYTRGSGKSLIAPASADISDATATGIALLTAASAAAGRAALSAAASGANGDVTNLTALANTLINPQGYSSCSGGTVTLANNAATGITLPNTISLVAILCGSASIAPKGIWYARPGTPTMTLLTMVTDATVDTTTGVLTGTTGTTGHVTVSAATDGKMYLENRSGGTRSFAYTVLGTA